MRTVELLTSKIPPFSLEAERAVLGAILLEKESLPKAIEVLKASDFYKEGHRKIFAAMIALFERAEPVDLVTLRDDLRRRGELEEAGGEAVLALLVEEAATAAHLTPYAEIVREKALLRELIRVSTEIIGQSYEAQADPSILLEQFRDRLNALDASGNGRSSLRPVSELTASPVEFLSEDLIPSAMLATLSGRDKRGKTLLGLELARAVLTGTALFDKFSVRPGPVAAYLLDDPPSVTLDRLTTLGIRNHPNLFVATGADVDLSDPLGLLRRARAEVRRIGARLVIIDALYLLMPSTRDAGNDQVRMRPLMLALNALAEKTGAAILLIAHDNKAGADVAGSHVIRAASKTILRLLLPHGTEEDPDEGPTTPERVLRIESKLLPGQTWRLRLDGVGAWHFHGTQREARTSEVRTLVQDWLSESNEGTARQAARAVERRLQDVQAALAALVEEGKAENAEVKTKGRPRRVYRTPSVPDQPEQKAFDPDPREQKSAQNLLIFNGNPEVTPFRSGFSLPRQETAGTKVGQTTSTPQLDGFEEVPL